MTSTRAHYARHLGPIYSWMAGGVEAALERGATELAALQLSNGCGALAVDLGAGFGMHSIPLARCGYAVLALDTDPALLQELAVLAGALPIDAVHGDLLDFRRHLGRNPRVVLCMGDTLTHLACVADVELLFAAVAAVLDPSGVFALSFRDYQAPLAGESRFIPVRSDPDRILTCFLEYMDSSVLVHDLLYERTPGGWNFRVSTYRKLRLDPCWVVATLEAQGLSVSRDTGLGGMIRLRAAKPGKRPS